MGSSGSGKRWRCPLPRVRGRALYLESNCMGSSGEREVPRVGGLLTWNPTAWGPVGVGRDGGAHCRGYVGRLFTWNPTAWGPVGLGRDGGAEGTWKGYLESNCMGSSGEWEVSWEGGLAPRPPSSKQGHTSTDYFILGIENN